MRTWWKRWAERLSRSAVPIDGDPGKWGRTVRPGRLEASAGTHRRPANGWTIELSEMGDLLPPPAV